MQSLADILIDVNTIKKSKLNEWQDHAINMAERLAIDLKASDIKQNKLSSQWFLFFKRAYKNNKVGIIDRCYGYLVDHPNLDSMSSSHKVRLFFKIYYVRLNNITR